MIREMGSKRDTSHWTPEYRLARTAAARQARAAGVRYEHNDRQAAAIKALEWLAWYGYSIVPILQKLTGRSRRLIDWMKSEDWIYFQYQMVRTKRRRRHGAAYSITSTVFLTRKGFNLVGKRLGLKLCRVQDAPELARHNLLTQLVGIALLRQSEREPDFTAHIPKTMNVGEPALMNKYRPDARLEISPPTVSIIDPETGAFPYQGGLYFIEVERSKKTPAELYRLASKLVVMASWGQPVLATEQESTMKALQEGLDAANADGFDWRKIETMILAKSHPDLLELLD